MWYILCRHERDDIVNVEGPYDNEEDAKDDIVNAYLDQDGWECKIIQW
jgi:hypothetical protein